MRSYYLGGLAIVLAAALFTSCSKNKDNNRPDIPAAGLMAFNLAPDQRGVVVRLSGSAVTSQPLDYTNYTGYYQQIYAGNRDVQSFNYIAGKAITGTQSYHFEENKSYSVFVIGNDSVYQNVVSIDSIEESKIAEGKAYIRYINAIADTINTTTVTASSGGSVLINDNASFATINEFTPVNAGEVAVVAKSSVVDINRTFSVQAGKAYTILLMGVPGEESEEKKPHIRYVENGTVVSGNAAE